MSKPLVDMLSKILKSLRKFLLPSRIVRGVLPLGRRVFLVLSLNEESCAPQTRCLHLHSSRLDLCIAFEAFNCLLSYKFFFFVINGYGALAWSKSKNEIKCME